MSYLFILTARRVWYIETNRDVIRRFRARPERASVRIRGTETATAGCKLHRARAAAADDDGYRKTTKLICGLAHA